MVRLEPLDDRHVAGLRAAATGAAGVEFAAVPTPETLDGYVAGALARVATGTYVSFAQLDARSGAVLGHTAFLTPRYWPGGDRLLAVEVGSTWLTTSARGTAVNTAAKLLLFTHAFESWGVARVDIKTDARNATARASIAAAGASFEGVLRSLQPAAAAGEQGRVRDTAMYSIISAQWPRTRTALEVRLARKLGAAGARE